MHTRAARLPQHSERNHGCETMGRSLGVPPRGDDHLADGRLHSRCYDHRPAGVRWNRRRHPAYGGRNASGRRGLYPLGSGNYSRPARRCRRIEFQHRTQRWVQRERFARGYRSIRWPHRDDRARHHHGNDGQARRDCDGGGGSGDGRADDYSLLREWHRSDDDGAGRHRANYRRRRQRHGRLLELPHREQADLVCFSGRRRGVDPSPRFGWCLSLHGSICQGWYCDRNARLTAGGLRFSRDPGGIDERADPALWAAGTEDCFGNARRARRRRGCLCWIRRWGHRS